MNSENRFPLIDCGANLSHDSFSEDLDQVITGARQAGIDQIMVTGTSASGSLDAALVAAKKPGYLFSTAGIHPHEAASFNKDSLAILKDLVGKYKVRAIGETGLDYFRDFSPRPAQQKAYAAQLGLAVELKMPVFLHQRDGHADFIRILREYRTELTKGVVHCFTGSEAELHDYLELDMHIGITGWICDERRGRHLHDIISLIPDNRLLLETDAPYLLPRTISPKPTSRRNEPANLVYVLKTVSACLAKSEKCVAEQTTVNARDFFNL